MTWSENCIDLAVSKSSYRCALPHLLDQVSKYLLLILIKCVCPYQPAQGFCHLHAIQTTTFDP